MSSKTSELRVALGDTAGCAVRESVVLSPMTHVRIGGPAAFLVEPYHVEAIAAIVRRCRELEAPLYVLGGGSNLLVADAGVEGVVLTLSRLNRIVREGDRITVGAGLGLPSLLRATREVGLAGLEVLCGVPAVVGGAVAMNAGTRDGATFDALASVTVVDPSGEICTLERNELSPRYRDGGLGGKIVAEATFALHEDDPAAIYARFERSLKLRNATQPVSSKSVGCVFKNPEGGPSAGQLIDAAGCKLLRRGDVSVSALHANYFVNEGEASSADFLALMREVRERVRTTSGVELVPEVKLWGVELPE